MYGFFMAGTILNFILLIGTPLAVKTRWFSLGLSIIGGISAIVVTVAAIVATALSFAAKVALTAQHELNIQAEVGYKMFGFMWTGAVFTLLAFILHAALGCCCRPDRTARASAQEDAATASDSEKKSGKMSLGSRVRRRKKAEATSENSDQVTTTTN